MAPSTSAGSTCSMRRARKLREHRLEALPGRGPFGQRHAARFQDREAPESALQRDHPDLVARDVEAHDSVHQSSFQYRSLPSRSSYFTTAVSVFSIRPARPVAVMRKVSLVETRKLLGLAGLSSIGFTWMPFALRMARKSCADIPRKLNIFFTWISWRMIAKRRGSRSLGSFGLAAAHHVQLLQAVERRVLRLVARNVPVVRGVLVGEAAHERVGGVGRVQRAPRLVEVDPV